MVNERRADGLREESGARAHGWGEGDSTER